MALIPLFETSAHRPTGLYAKVGDDIAPQVARMGMWSIRKRYGGMHEPAIRMPIQFEGQQVKEWDLRLCRLAYLFYRSTTDVREAYTKKESFEALYHQIQQLCRVRHADKDVLNSLEDNLVTTTNRYVRKLREQKLGYQQDFPPETEFVEPVLEPEQEVLPVLPPQPQTIVYKEDPVLAQLKKNLSRPRKEEKKATEELPMPGLDQGDLENYTESEE